MRCEAAGQTLETVHIDNDPLAFVAQLAKAGPEPEVALEAAYGRYCLLGTLITFHDRAFPAACIATTLSSLSPFLFSASAPSHARDIYACASLEGW